MHMLWRVSTTTDTATNTKRAHSLLCPRLGRLISSRHSHHHHTHHSHHSHPGHIGADYNVAKAARSSNLLWVVVVADLAAVHD